MILAGSCSHILIKIAKRFLPSLANFYTASTIIGIRRIIRVKTPLFDTTPYRKFSCASFPVLQMTYSGYFIMIAAATFYTSAFYILRTYRFFLSAITKAEKPTVTTFCLNKFKHSKKIEFSTCQIMKFTHLATLFHGKNKPVYQLVA